MGTWTVMGIAVLLPVAVALVALGFGGLVEWMERHRLGAALVSGIIGTLYLAGALLFRDHDTAVAVRGLALTGLAWWATGAFQYGRGRDRSGGNE